jgi:hypothetical protein
MPGCDENAYACSMDGIIKYDTNAGFGLDDGALHTLLTTLLTATDSLLRDTDTLWTLSGRSLPQMVVSCPALLDRLDSSPNQHHQHS